MNEKIIQLIKTKKYSNEFIGRQINMTGVSVANMLKGKTKINIDLIFWVQKEFGVSLNWLMLDRGEKLLPPTEGISQAELGSLLSNQAKMEKRMQFLEGKNKKLGILLAEFQKEFLVLREMVEEKLGEK